MRLGASRMVPWRMNTDQRRHAVNDAGESGGADDTPRAVEQLDGAVPVRRIPGDLASEKAMDARRNSAPIERVTAYKLAIALGELTWADAAIMKPDPLLSDVARQLVRAIGSIAANVAEGYTRRSPRERIRFYEYALGSTEEADAWYVTGRFVLPQETFDDRTDRLTAIRRLLLTMIRNERAIEGWNSPRRKAP